MADLTTLSSAKTHLQLTVSTYDALLSALITQVSASIERTCARTFAANNYVEFSNSFTGQQRVQVRNKPIIRVNSVRWGVATAIQLTYNGSAPFASAQVTGDGRCILTTIDGTGNNDTTFNLTTSTLTLCSQLITGINAVSGFKGILIGTTDIPTKWLNPTSGVTLRSSSSAFATQSLNWPPVDIFEYYIDPTFSTIGFSPLTSMDYFFTPDARAITPLSWPQMYQGLCVDYRGGYETIPADVALVANLVTAETFFRTTRDTSLQSERLDDYSYAVIDPLMRQTLYLDMLAPYRTIPLAGGMG